MALRAASEDKGLLCRLPPPGRANTNKGHSDVFREPHGGSSDGCVRNILFAPRSVQCPSILFIYLFICFLALNTRGPVALEAPVSPACGLNAIRSSRSGILNYSEAAVWLFGLGVHLWICIMVFLKPPQECSLKRNHKSESLPPAETNVPRWNTCPSPGRTRSSSSSNAAAARSSAFIGRY